MKQTRALRGGSLWPKKQIDCGMSTPESHTPARLLKISNIVTRGENLWREGPTLKSREEGDA